MLDDEKHEREIISPTNFLTNNPTNDCPTITRCIKLNNLRFVVHKAQCYHLDGDVDVVSRRVLNGIDGCCSAGAHRSTDRCVTTFLLCALTSVRSGP